VAVTFDLNDSPMVMGEISNSLAIGQSSFRPIIVNEKTGLRYTENQFRLAFRHEAGIAGIPKDFWARDLPASGMTEAREI
jgi:hypothetical protein